MGRGAIKRQPQSKRAQGHIGSQLSFSTFRLRSALNGSTAHGWARRGVDECLEAVRAAELGPHLGMNPIVIWGKQLLGMIAKLA